MEAMRFINAIARLGCFTETSNFIRNGTESLEKNKVVIRCLKITIGLLSHLPIGGNPKQLVSLLSSFIAPLIRNENAAIRELNFQALACFIMRFILFCYILFILY